jgi:hypothetical protein
VAVIANASERCDELLSAAVSMGRVLPDAVLADVRTEIVPFGFDGRGLQRGIEGALKAEDFEPGMLEGWERE